MRTVTLMELNGYKVAVEFIAEFNHFSKEPYFCLKINGKVVVHRGTHLTTYMSNIKSTEEKRFYADLSYIANNINVLPEALGMTKRIFWSNKEISMCYSKNEVGEPFFQVTTKYPKKINDIFKDFLRGAIYQLRIYSPMDHISLSELQEWFIKGLITEEEADRRIQYFYVKDEDSHCVPEKICRQDWVGNIIEEVENKFSDCRVAQEWRSVMNYRFISRKPYEVWLAILDE